uniref:hypothetical protein n=1 Tax=Herbidospora sakaeratensis TaxID=564415 RepID=UPI000A57BA21|nr:hypothetical protein [Herbidospora sakaeratensis]
MWWIVIRLVGAPLVGIVSVVWLSRTTWLDPFMKVFCILGSDRNRTGAADSVREGARSG